MAIGQDLDITEESEEYEERLPQWRKVRDAMAGEDRVKERGTEYLPKPSGMKDPRKFTAYKERASFYDVADRTLSGLEGLVFRVEPVVKVPAALEPMLKDVTSTGAPIQVMLHEAMREVASMGRYGQLVDLPRGLSLTALPRISTYLAEDILRWEEQIVGGARKVVRIVLREEATVTGTQRTERLVELFLDPVDGFYTMQHWRQKETETTSSRNTPRSDRVVGEQVSGDFDKVGDPIKPDIRGTKLEEIPFTFINTIHLRPRTEKPPFIPMVNMALAHYRNSADYEHALFMACQPQPWAVGVTQEERPRAIGAGGIWFSSNKDAKFGMLEVNGQSIPNQRQAMQDKETRMAILGALLIQEDRQPSNVTAETTRLQTRSQTSVLVNTVDSVTAGTERSLRVAAVWMGADPDEVSVGFSKDFIETRLSSDELTALVAGWQGGAYSRQTLHENLQSGEVIPATRSLDDERELQEADDDAGDGGMNLGVPGGGQIPKKGGETDGGEEEGNEEEEGAGT